MDQVAATYHGRDFWIRENLLYATPNFRARKAARVVNGIAAGGRRTLLDVGCGPATLKTLLDPAIEYHGIDIAIQSPAPYLVEMDFVGNPIAFKNKRFDIVVALGVFEYLGDQQDQKCSEIRDILAPEGKLLVSYINFRHFRRRIFPIYNNIHTIKEFALRMGRVFQVERCFPVSHHWRHKQPGERMLPALQMQMEWNVPCFSSWLAVEYFVVCSPRRL
jgi:SAM-dependent methyltransferase